MKVKMITAALTLALAANTAHAAPTINWQPGSGTLPAKSTIIADFDSATAGSLIGTGTYALDTSNSLGAVPAFGSSGNYASITRNGSFSLNFLPTSMLSFVLGSLDTYNAVDLYFSDNTSLRLEGSDIIGVTPPPFADGNQNAAATNGVVSYSAGSGPKISSVTFSSTVNSFEIDNVAVAAVPEPATWAMLILGIGLVGGALRQTRRTVLAY